MDGGVPPWLMVVFLPGGAGGVILDGWWCASLVDGGVILDGWCWWCDSRWMVVV